MINKFFEFKLLSSEQMKIKVLVFKTSVRHKYHVDILAPELKDYGKWNFDLDDCDKILRVENDQVSGKAITAILEKYGFKCEELE